MQQAACWELWLSASVRPHLCRATMLAVLTCDAPVAPEVRSLSANLATLLALVLERCAVQAEVLRCHWCIYTCLPMPAHSLPRLAPQVWRGMFKRGAINSFNQITVDGDTSTNDTVIGLASGLAGGEGQFGQGGSVVE